MAIAFNCPHCQFDYRLPDKLAGKQAKCKNPDCRKVITIPAPITIPGDDDPALDAAAAEAAALAALADEAPKKEEGAPSDEKVIPMTCEFCEHKWAEPWSKAGKNTLCPNPECRRRVKVPEPKEDVPYDWRQTKSKLPSMAKDAQPKLDGEVMDAEATKRISDKTVKDAGLIDDDVEPQPLKEKLLIRGGIAGVILAVIFGIWYWQSSRVEHKEDQLMADARTAFDEAAKEMTPTDAALSSALLNLAAAEYTLRKEPVDLKLAYEFYAKGLTEVRKQPPGLARDVVAAELALTLLEFGGTPEEAREQLRFAWTPDGTTGAIIKMKERTHTIFEELGNTCQLLQPFQPTDFDFRVTTARRLTRAMAKRGQPGLAADLIPLALFTDQEKPEARALVALEIHKATPGTDVPRKVAEDLKAVLAAGYKGPTYSFPASAHTLFTLLGTVNSPKLLQAPPPAKGSVSSEPVVLAYVGLSLLEGKPDAALDLAKRAGQPESQLRALVLYAEWSSDPGAAFDAAQVVLAGKVRPSPANILRLSQLAAEAGRHDQSKALADALQDDALKAWARGDAARLRIAANPKEKADETWVELPDVAKNQRPGHAWGRMWIARQNAKLSHERDSEKKTVKNWPSTVRPFGLAGIGLGLQDPQP